MGGTPDQRGHPKRRCEKNVQPLALLLPLAIKAPCLKIAAHQCKHDQKTADGVAMARAGTSAEETPAPWPNGCGHRDFKKDQRKIISASPEGLLPWPPLMPRQGVTIAIRPLWPQWAFCTRADDVAASQ